MLEKQQVQLKSAVHDAETRLEHLREEHSRFKNDTEDLTKTESHQNSGPRALYEELLKKGTSNLSKQQSS